MNWSNWKSVNILVVNKDLINPLSEQQMNTLGERLLTELNDVGAYYLIRVVWGRKQGVHLA